MVNAGVSENCSLICRVGRETARGLHSCAEVAPHPPLETKAPQRCGVCAEGGRAEGRGTGRGRAGAQLQASQGADGEVASGGAQPTPPHASWPRGGCAVEGLTLSRACVCVHTSGPGGSCLHPLSPLAGGSRGFTARDGVGVSPPGTQTHTQAAMPALLLMALGFCRLSQRICSSPACSALGKERARAGASGLCSAPSCALSSFGGCLSPR